MELEKFSFLQRKQDESKEFFAKIAQREALTEHERKTYNKIAYGMWQKMRKRNYEKFEKDKDSLHLGAGF